MNKAFLANALKYLAGEADSAQMETIERTLLVDPDGEEFFEDLRKDYKFGEMLYSKFSIPVSVNEQSAAMSKEEAYQRWIELTEMDRGDMLTLDRELTEPKPQPRLSVYKAS